MQGWQIRSGQKLSGSSLDRALYHVYSIFLVLNMGKAWLSGTWCGQTHYVQGAKRGADSPLLSEFSHPKAVTDSVHISAWEWTDIYICSMYNHSTGTITDPNRERICLEIQASLYSYTTSCSFVSAFRTLFQVPAKHCTVLYRYFCFKVSLFRGVYEVYTILFKLHNRRVTYCQELCILLYLLPYFC